MRFLSEINSPADLRQLRVEDLQEVADVGLCQGHQLCQGEAPDATGHRGFFYHFLDVATGRRAWRCELSTIDTTLLLAGALFCQSYFDRDDPEEAEIRSLAETLYRRAEWSWADLDERSFHRLLANHGRWSAEHSGPDAPAAWGSRPPP